MSCRSEAKRRWRLNRPVVDPLLALEYLRNPVALVVITTVGTEDQANLLGEELVERRQAACVNILPVQRSIYRWKGQVCSDSEYLLVVKTLPEKYAEVEATIQELHHYELPEILAFRVTGGEPRFFEWIRASVGEAVQSEDGIEPVDPSALPASE